MRTACLALTLLLLSACGQKGPLYLPEPASNVVVRPAPAAAPASAPTSTPAPDDASKDKDGKPKPDRSPP